MHTPPLAAIEPPLLFPHNAFMNAAEKLPFTAQDYLDWERQQTTKHEFVQGETFAMAGANEAHVTISLNVASTLKQHLRGTPAASTLPT